jgi:hypothetical protein
MMRPQFPLHLATGWARSGRRFLAESLANVGPVRYPRASYPAKGISVNKAFNMTSLQAAKPAMMPAWSTGTGRIVARADDGSILAVRCMR